MKCNDFVCYLILLLHLRYESIYEMKKFLFSILRSKEKSVRNFHWKLALENIIMNGRPFVGIEMIFVASHVSYSIYMCVLCCVSYYNIRIKTNCMDRECRVCIKWSVPGIVPPKCIMDCICGSYYVMCSVSTNFWSHNFRIQGNCFSYKIYLRSEIDDGIEKWSNCREEAI